MAGGQALRRGAHRRGVRLVANNTLLFESIVNAAHVTSPECRFVFNRAAVATPEDIRRWYPQPEETAR
ncbi:hypothetical protein [Mycobacterium intermedium]|uniref:hypothetical protein n=1 Tax=Mycobacterium intermedium TaxID=28445 RepID=UPI001E52D055|nr:hypothetical protein [Mycobacterium intermedium]